MKKSTIWKTIQIIPAESGWKAVHCEGSENGHARIFNRSIICWALVEAAAGEGEGRRTEVRGVEQNRDHFVVVEDAVRTEIGEDGIDRNQYFLGYDDPHAHEESNYWVKQADTRIKAEKEKRA